MLKRFIAALLACFLCCFTAFAEGGSVSEDIVAFQLEKNGVSSVHDWAAGLEAGSEWYVFALRQYLPETDFSAYAASLEAAMAENKANPVTRQKYALALIAAGKWDGAFVPSAADETTGEQGIMSYIFGLHLLNNGAFSEKYTPEKLVSELCGLALTDGGWAVSGERSDADVTAMAVQALAPYYAENADVIDKALGFLSGSQLPDGDFQSYGTANAESTSQVIIALCSLGIDPLTDARFIKNGKTLLDGLKKYRLTDGSFSHDESGRYSALATVQAFCAAVSLETERPLFIFTEESAAEEAAIPEYTTPAETKTPEITTAAAAAVTAESAEKAPVQKRDGYKPAALAIIAGTVLLVCAVLLIFKKGKPKNLAFTAVIGLAAALFVLFTSFSGAEDYYTEEKLTADETAGYARIAIYCDTIAGAAEHVPADGVILAEASLPFREGATVYDVLISAAKKYGIRLENSGSAELAYISSIQSISERDFGELSGWMYFVNGDSPSVGCGEYPVSDGDIIEWKYTRDIGNDLR